MNRPIAIPLLIVLFMLVASAAMAQNIPTHQMSFSINATRTLTSQTDTKDSAGDCGRHYNKDNSIVSVTFSATSDKITFSDFGNSTQSPGRALNSPATDSDQAFSGSGRITFSGSCDDGIDCGGCKTCCSGDGTSSWNVSENINLTSTASFEYDRGKKQGRFNLTCKCDDPQGNADGKMNFCDSQYLPSVNVELQKAGLKVVGDLLEEFAIQNYSIYSGMRVAQAIKDQMQKALDGSGNGGIATITATASGYEVHYSNTVSSSGTPPGCTGNASSTLTTNVSVSIGGQPIVYDAILVPIGTMPSPGSGKNTVGTYEKWEPEGPPFKNGAPVGTEGNSVTFQAELVMKGHEDQPVTDVPFKVDYKLTSSTEPGIALNYPANGGGQSDPDLQFNAELANSAKIVTLTKDELISNDSEGANVAAIITSYDYGSYGTLTAKVTLANGGMTYDAHLKDSTSTTINLPKDDNNNHIADQWEIDSGIYSKNYSEDWDKVKQPNNGKDGDGITLYEKYRGIIAKGKHIRISPNFKNVIVVNPGGVDLSQGIALFEGASNINVIALDSVGELDPDTKVINVNHSTAHGGDQHGIKFVMEAPGDGSAAKAVAIHDPAGVAYSPGDVEKVQIDPASTGDELNWAIAHELAHCLFVHHHGNSSCLQMSAPVFGAIQNGNIKLVNEQGAPVAMDNGGIDITDLQGQKHRLMPPKSVNDTPFDLAQPGSQASGDVNCIMAYNGIYNFMEPDPKTIIVMNDHPHGIQFCTASAGTKWNSHTNHYIGGFGDAIKGAIGDAENEGGDCMHQFQVKDWK